MPRWSCLVLVVFVGLAAAGETSAPRGRTADLTLRYVNDSVISFGDVLQRNAMRLSDHERRGRPTPNTRADLLAFSQQSLDDLTEEELLIQYGRALAEERGFQLVDHERISQVVMERARASGRGRTLREQAEERRFLERQQIMDLVLGYFESRTPHISPQDLERSYQEREQEFRRPARARVYQIVLRPAGIAERQELRQARIAVFKQAQDVTDAVVRAASESRIEAYIVASPDEQERLLVEAVREIASQSARGDLDAGSRQVVERAIETEQRVAALRDAEQVRRDLEALRAELEGKDLEAFRAAARRVSQGPGAADGGLLGWVEPGTHPAAFDQVVFTQPLHSPSPVFVVDQLAYLTWVAERSEATIRSFGEVVGELESALRRSQQSAARRAAVAMLRAKASVRDIITIAQLVE
jgi:hypothetical protein